MMVENALLPNFGATCYTGTVTLKTWAKLSHLLPMRDLVKDVIQCHWWLQNMSNSVVPPDGRVSLGARQSVNTVTTKSRSRMSIKQTFDRLHEGVNWTSFFKCMTWTMKQRQIWILLLVKGKGTSFWNINYVISFKRAKGFTFKTIFGYWAGIIKKGMRNILLGNSTHYGRAKRSHSMAISWLCNCEILSTWKFL